MRIKKNDYLVVMQDKGGDYLARALEDGDGKTVEAVVEKNVHIQGQRHTLTVSGKDIKLNLGADPKPGKVYGIDVGNLYRGSKIHDDFGKVCFFYKPDKEVVKDLWHAMSRVAKKLRKLGLEFLLDDIMWEIQRYQKEPHSGMFVKSKKENIPDRIQFKPESISALDYEYILYHEIGHNLHMCYATGKKLNAQWLRLFNTSIRVATVRKDTATSLLDQMLDQQDLPSDFKGQLPEEEALAFKWIVRTIQSVNGLNLKDLDILFEADCHDDIRKVWPARTLPRKDLQPIVSEYATKNYYELVAEAFAFHMTGKKLPGDKPMPQQIIKLLEKTYSYAKANREKS